MRNITIASGFAILSPPVPRLSLLSSQSEKARENQRLEGERESNNERGRNTSRGAQGSEGGEEKNKGDLRPQRINGEQNTDPGSDGIICGATAKEVRETGEYQRGLRCPF